MNIKIPSHILPVIVFAQFAGTSLWFAGNAVADILIVELGLSQIFLGYITIAVQAGFILGSLFFAVFNIADRFSPVRVFLFCSIFGAVLNVSIIVLDTATPILIVRFLTGFFLAGIYPVGMKIASDWHDKGLGKALGYLVGALVIGTAFPHLLKFVGGELPWRFVFIGTSVISASGGFLLYFTVKDGPYRAVSLKSDYSTIFKLFKNKNFRSAALGYLGHMWELYTFWTFVPIMLIYFVESHSKITLPVSLWSFIIIGIGGLSCILGGYISLQKSSKWVSVVALIGSGICCLLIPFMFSLPIYVFLLVLLLWGIFVIPDSPQFSSLIAHSSDDNLVATGLTIVNSIGFALTIVSIQLVSYFWSLTQSPMVFLIMLFGPIFGLLSVKNYSQ